MNAVAIPALSARNAGRLPANGFTSEFDSTAPALSALNVDCASSACVSAVVTYSDCIVGDTRWNSSIDELASERSAGADVSNVTLAIAAFAELAMGVPSCAAAIRGTQMMALRAKTIARAQ